MEEYPRGMSRWEFLEYDQARVQERNLIIGELAVVRDLASMTNSAHVLDYVNKRLEEL